MGRKIKPLTIRYHFVNSPDSEERVQRAFNRIFDIAKENLLKKQKRNKIRILVMSH